MRTIRTTTACLAAAAVMVLIVQSPARPQGSGSSRAAPPRETRPPTPEELQVLRTRVDRAGSLRR